MASWITNISGEIEDPARLKELLGDLKSVISKPEYGTGSSEFTSPHVLAQNFHVPDPDPPAPDPATGGPGGESTGGDWTPGGATAPA